MKYVEKLSEKCIEGVTIVMMLRQSQRAIDQTEATMKLTLLAFNLATAVVHDFVLLDTGQRD